MNTTRRILATALAGAVLGALAVTGRAEDEAWLFAYFKGNGADGLHLAASTDGYTWEALNGDRPFLAPRLGQAKLLRDPCVVRGPDGTYHMVWTTGWWENHIGHASTRDFVTWTEQRELPVMAHEPTVRNTWAPEVVHDAARDEFVIFWASTIPGRFAERGASEDGLDHRLYATTTRDWREFTPTRLFHDPGFSVIDATFQRAEGGELWLIIKDETREPPRKHLRVARAESFLGPFGELAPPFTPEGTWVEGPTSLRVGDSHLVYYDRYRERRYGAQRTRDFQTWEEVGDQIRYPEGMRHGTAFAVPRALLETLRGVTVELEPPPAAVVR